MTAKSIKSRNRQTLWSSSRRTGFALFVFGVVGCGDISPVQPDNTLINDPALLYTSLTLNYPAVNLSTAADSSSQVQLVATPRDVAGNPMVGLPAPIYTSTDTQRVKVTQDGLVTAIGAGTGFQVRVQLTHGSVTHYDTAWINVKTPTTPTLDSFSIHPLSVPDSGVWAIPYLLDNGAGTGSITGYAWYGAGLTSVSPFGPLTVIPRMISSLGASLPPSNFQIEYRSLDPSVAVIGRRDGSVALLNTGQVRIVARTFAYGVSKADTTTYVVVPPYGFAVSTDPTTTPQSLPYPLSNVKIRVGGVMIWTNIAGALDSPLQITFDDPTAATAVPEGMCDALGPDDLGFSPLDCGAGNATLPVEVFAAVVRRFMVPGVYTYHASFDPPGAVRKITVGDVLE